MIYQKKFWKLNEVNNEDIKRVISETGISELMAMVLVNRGYTEIETIKKFLNPDFNQLHSPFLLKDIQKAVERIYQEINNKGKIIIYGDYDVDGVTSTSVLYNYLRTCDAQVEYYIPDRFEEGYGLNMNRVQILCTQKPALIITVDNGITAIKEIEFIKNQGIDVIVTDHHECLSTIPSAFAVINPKQPDCSYPFKYLAGVGVVYKLVQALAKRINGDENLANKYLDLVCLGTIADVVPLIDENRILTKYGLECISQTQNIGLKALCKDAEIKEFSTWVISYLLSPRINAAGRLGRADRAVELFTTQDIERTRELAGELNKENKNRQEIEAELAEEILEKIIEEQLEKKNILVVHGENWHHGVIGIVASRIIEKFHKPCILISFEGDVGRGSGRSVDGFNLFDALGQCGHLLEKHGGHELAGGLTIHKSKIQEFKILIEGIADDTLKQKKLVKAFNVDARITKELLNLKSVSELKNLEPCGMGNPVPLFYIEQLKIENLRAVGDNKHLKLGLNCEGSKLDAIGFRFGELHQVLKMGDSIDVVCVAEINQYAGKKTVQLNIKDIKLNEEAVLEQRYYNTFNIEVSNPFSEACVDHLNFNFTRIELNRLVNLINTEEKNIFLINTLEASKCVLKYLEINAYDLTKSIGVYYNNIDIRLLSDEEAIINAFVINPILSQIDFSTYDNIILCDVFFKLDCYGTMNESSNGKKIFVLSDFEDVKYNLQVLDNIGLERSHLATVYNFLKNNCINNQINYNIVNFNKVLIETHNEKLNPFVINQSLEVMQELNLIIKANKGDEYKIELVLPQKTKSNLDDSNQYTTILKYKQDFGNVIRFLSNVSAFQETAKDSSHFCGN